ncbi:MAG: GLUG motif-containing protein, partial [Prevotella sp.]
MNTTVATFRLFVTAFCLFCINLVALADETSLPANWDDYGKLATFTNGERIDEDIVLSTVEGRPTYTIYTARGLAWVAYATNNGMTGGDYPESEGFEGCTVELGNDLSLAQPAGFPNGFASWTPIGTSSHPFLGTFDGNYKVISGLKVTDAESAGLFGYVGNSTNSNEGKISNLGVKDASIEGTKYAGAIAGQLYGTMEKCWSSGSVKVSGTDAEAGGGLVGNAIEGSTISNCYSTASVTAPLAGGVVGSINGTFSYCYATGAVTSNGTASSGSGAAGGICGKLITSADAEIKRNFALNKDGIAAQENGDVGRIIGNVSAGGSITYTDNYASVLIDGVWSETDINGKACTFDKLNLLCQDNAFMCDNTYLPKLVDGSSNVMPGQSDLNILDYIGGGSITVTSSGNSNISETKESAICGETVEFTVTPESEWYYIVSVKVNKVNDDGSLGDEVFLSQPSGKYSFTMPETPVMITVNIDAIDTWEEYAVGAVSGTDYNKDGTTYTINTARGLAWVAYVTNIKK